MKSKVIFSYSLYGNNPRYVEPLFELDFERIYGKLQREVEFHVFCNIDVTTQVIDKLRLHGCIVTIQDFENEKIGGMFARYQPIFNDDDASIVIRDIDSHISDAELDLIGEWLDSKYEFHIIRDHVLHIYPIMGGLFAVRGATKKTFAAIYQKYRNMTKSCKYNSDQVFLSEKIYPVIVKNALVHSRRIVYKQENYRKIESLGGGFAGETKVVDEKRRRENHQSLVAKNILILPSWISKIAIRKPFNRIVTFMSLQLN